MANKKIAIAYIPVLHRGYLDFLHTLEADSVDELYLISDEILESHAELDYINRKDRLRAIPHAQMLGFIGGIVSIPVFSLTTKILLSFSRTEVSVLMPKEDINTYIAETYLSGFTITYKNVFLRWNKENVGDENEPKTEVILLSDFEKNTVQAVFSEAGKSADWWRQVGAALVKNGDIVAIAHNEHMPTKELPNILGDTRALFSKGVNVNYVTAAHAEVGVIAEAAQKGISTEGTVIFVTDFPCPYCARLIAKSGIKKVYYAKGYAVLGGDDFFKDMNIEVVKVDIPT